jgi:hypothetical protein
LILWAQVSKRRIPRRKQNEKIYAWPTRNDEILLSVQESDLEDGQADLAAFLVDVDGRLVQADRPLQLLVLQSMLRIRGQFFKAKLAPTLKVGAYASFKKLTPGANPTIFEITMTTL